MVQPSVHSTRTMTNGMTTVLCHLKELGGMTLAIQATSMDDTSVDHMLATLMELAGIRSRVITTPTSTLQ